MPTIREDLQLRLQLDLSRRLSTLVPSQTLVEIAADATKVVGEWLARTYDEHSLEIEIYGQPAPQLARPSFEWLCENMKA